MLSYNGVSVPTCLEDICRPDRMALVVYDMQVGILRQLRDTGPLLERVRLAIDTARKAGMRIVYLRHLSAPKPWMGAFQMRMAMAWQRKENPEEVSPWFLRDGPAVSITPEIAPRPEDLVLDKLSMSAFEGTPLAMALRDCGLVSIALCGVATEIGIEPTARHAADLGFVPVLIEDACGAGHAEAGERALAGLRFLGDAMFTTAAGFAGHLANMGALAADGASSLGRADRI